MRRAGPAAGLLVTVAALAGAGTLSAYRTGPPPGHTGAFGEPDCGACHFDAIREDDSGTLEVRAPPTYRPGETVELVVVLRHPDAPAAGFQLTTRFMEGRRAGRQAGALEATSDRTRVQWSEDGVAYASHAAPGVARPGAGPFRWTVRWIAPVEPGPVAVDVAAQLANDDDSEFGERFYADRIILPPERGDAP